MLSSVVAILDRCHSLGYRPTAHNCRNWHTHTHKHNCAEWSLRMIMRFDTLYARRGWGNLIGVKEVCCSKRKFVLSVELLWCRHISYMLSIARYIGTEPTTTQSKSDGKTRPVELRQMLRTTCSQESEPFCPPRCATDHCASTSGTKWKQLYPQQS